jgi:hypothetical protein
MALYIDLSSEKLDAKAVARFAKEQARTRSSEDILLKVSPRAHKLVCVGHRSGGVKVSTQELRKLNTFLKRSLPASAFVIRTRNKCRKCARTLTFYDLFQSGRARHSDSHIKNWFAGNAYHVHLQRRGQKFPIKCTSCGTVNVLSKLMYDGPDY